MKFNRANYDGDTAIVLTFSGIIGQIALDTTQRPMLADFGLTYKDEADSAQVASVTVQRNGTELLVELDQSPSGTKRGISYAKEGNVRDASVRCDPFEARL